MVVLSPGFGESRSSYARLALHWASHGYITLVVTHIGTDTESLTIGERPPADPVHLVLRPGDLRFVLDRVTSDRLPQPLLDGRIDEHRIGVVGHSLGSTTALQLAGLTVNLLDRAGASDRDERVRAAIAMSPQFRSPRYARDRSHASERLGVTAASWDGIRTPVMFLVGTRDRGLGALLRAHNRVLDWAFGRSAGPPRYLVKIVGAEHHAFTDTNPWYPAGDRDPRHHGWICQATTAFLDAFLQDEAGAYQWLRRSALEKVTHGGCLLESE